MCSLEAKVPPKQIGERGHRPKKRLRVELKIIVNLTYVEAMVLLDTMMWAWIEEEWRDHPLNPVQKKVKKWFILAEIKDGFRNRNGYSIDKGKWQPNEARLRAAEKKRSDEGETNESVSTRSYLEFRTEKKKSIKSMKDAPSKTLK